MLLTPARQTAYALVDDTGTRAERKLADRGEKLPSGGLITRRAAQSEYTATVHEHDGGVMLPSFCSVFCLTHILDECRIMELITFGINVAIA